MGVARDKTVFVLIDLQEKFIPVMHGIDSVVENTNILLESAEIMGVPVLVMEHYPKGLGKTSEKIKLRKSKKFEKIAFSCFGCDEFADKIKDPDITDLVIFGIETHICILGTALDALDKGLRVHVVADAVASRTENNKSIGLTRLQQAGAYIVSTEMILFQLLKVAGTDEFKKINGLVN